MELIRRLTMTCAACPLQYEGELWDGRRLYFRYRFGWARLGVGPDDEAARRDEDAAGVQVGDELDGSMSPELFGAVFFRLLLVRLGDEVPALMLDQVRGAAMPRPDGSPTDDPAVAAMKRRTAPLN